MTADTTPQATPELRARIKEIVCDILEIDIEEMSDTSLFKEDHEADSMGAIEILSTLERVLGVDIEQGELSKMRDLNGVVEVVRAASAH